MIKVLLAEDHDLVREGTRQLLERAEELEIVGEARDGEEAVRLTDMLLPDIVAMDVRMPRLDGLQATRQIKARHPSVRVLILSAYEDDEYVFPLLEAGASGYLLKTASGAELIRAIHTIDSGETVLSPHIASKVVSQLTAKQSGKAVRETPEDLTTRELSVLQAVASGKSNKEIAEALCITTNTVQVHLRNIFSKLGVGSRTEAVTSALARGLIRLDTGRK